MRLPFELDSKIIHHIFYGKAEPLVKAVIALLMNAIDAKATSVFLNMSKESFKCTDDGQGFTCFDDVLHYFGRFAPRNKCSATYRRFRLGRGQILAHASTKWSSNRWAMKVDTRSMGYDYDLEDLAEAVAGFSITGTWYEPLNDLELMSATQEICDLVRYTTVRIELNGRVISRNPALEKWDFEDEWAYYRTKEEGPFSLYNQGVLVPHDSSYGWAGAGLIVSKQAISLNPSRTEILRKTCPVWKSIAKTFSRLLELLSGKFDVHRKTEALREKLVGSLLKGDANIGNICRCDQVITLLPGERRISLHALLQKADYGHKHVNAIVDYDRNVPASEARTDDGLYLAIGCKILKRLIIDAFKTEACTVRLVEHEVVYQDESVNCGSDAALCHHCHRISIMMGPERQRFIPIWLWRYALNFECEGRKSCGRALNERHLVGWVSSGRIKPGFKPLIKDLSTQTLVMAPVPEKNPSLWALINGRQNQKKGFPGSTALVDVFEHAHLDLLVANEREAEAAEAEKRYQAIQQDFEQAKASIAAILGLEVSAIDADAMTYLCECWVWEGQQDREEVLKAWEDKDWENASYDVEDDHEYPCEHDIEEPPFEIDEEWVCNDPQPRLDEDCRSLVRYGETWWILKRHTAAAGFWRVEEYLKWRHANQGASGDLLPPTWCR